MANNSYNKDTVKVALNSESNARANVKDKIDISSQAWKARMMPSGQEKRFIAFDSDSAINRRYTVETDVNEITKVEDDGSSQLKVTAEGHGYSDGDNIVLGGFSNESINVQGTVSSKTDDTFVVTEIAWSSDYSDDTGYVAKVSDSITGDELRIQPDQIVEERIPFGNQDNYYPQESGSGSIDYYDDFVVVLHVKQVTSAASSYLRIEEK